MKRLPNKLYKLLNIALKDIALCDNDDYYNVNMGFWHDASNTIPSCNVCLAGSIMAQTLKTNKYESVVPESFNADTEKKLYALNDIRTLHLRMAYQRLVKKPKKKTLNALSDIEIEYDIDTTRKLAFFPIKYMSKWKVIAKRLEKLNI